MLIEEEVVLFALPTIDYVLLQLILLQSQLLPLEPVVLLPSLVTRQDRFQLASVGSSRCHDHLTLPPSALSTVDVALEDAVDESADLSGVGEVEIRHAQDGSSTQLPSRTTISGIA